MNLCHLYNDLIKQVKSCFKKCWETPRYRQEPEPVFTVVTSALLNTRNLKSLKNSLGRSMCLGEEEFPEGSLDIWSKNVQTEEARG